MERKEENTKDASHFYPKNIAFFPQFRKMSTKYVRNFVKFNIFFFRESKNKFVEKYTPINIKVNIVEISIMYCHFGQ